MSTIFYKEIPADILKELLEKNTKEFINTKYELDISSLYKEKEGLIKSCPHCEYTYFIKHGSYKGIQRFKCKNKECDRTFSVATKSPWSYSKKDISLWAQYLNLMSDSKSIRSCADILKIATSTAFYWRHKILSAKTLFVEPKKLTGTVEMFKVNFKQNFKGSREIPPEFINNRKNIWVASAIDINDNLLSKPVSDCYFKKDLVEKSLFSKIDKSAFVNSYGDRFLNALAKRHNKKLTPSTSDNSVVIKSFSINIKRWLRIFRGVASKYLCSYLSWYITIFRSNHKNIIRFMELLTLENSFKANKEFIKSEICAK